MHRFNNILVCTSLALLVAPSSLAVPLENSKRSILTTDNGIITVPYAAQPANWATSQSEPFAQYHLRYWVIGCEEKKDTAFFDKCCTPRSAQMSSDEQQPLACRLSAYQVYNPIYGPTGNTAQLESVSNTTASGYPIFTPQEDAVSKDNVAVSPISWSASSSSVFLYTYTPSSASSSGPAASSTPERQHLAVYVPTSSPSAASLPASSSWAPTPSSSPEPVVKAAYNAQPASSSSSEAHFSVPPVVYVPTTTATSTSTAWTSTSSSIYVAPTSSTPAPATSYTSDFTGQATWFTQEGVAGACGTVHSDSDSIVALKTDLYGWTGQKSQYCGRSLTITNLANSKTATATVADACPGCASYYSLDLSTGLFQQLGDMNTGVLQISWHFN